MSTQASCMTIVLKWISSVFQAHPDEDQSKEAGIVHEFEIFDEIVELLLFMVIVFYFCSLKVGFYFKPSTLVWRRSPSSCTLADPN